ncbi:MAG: tyrosine-type recombinase/integrase [Clostridia bacterium]|nr:tyrosine-type recombinase/integrase [Clostridia bacterium]
MDKNDFQTRKHSAYTLKIREIQKELPAFCAAFFRSLENTTSVLTRYAYAVDLRSFFQYAVSEAELFCGRELSSLTLDDLDKIRAVHIEMYLEQMSLYSRDERERTNQERAKARKLSALRSFFKYYFRQELLPSNVAALVETPKIHDKAIIRLEPNEVADLLDLAESGEGLSERQKQYNRNTRVRDVAILTLFLGTGIRISELIGIDLDDVDFESNEFLVTSKGGAQDILAFGDEVRSALAAYYGERSAVTAQPGHENALFLSIQRRRITARAVEYLVKKYAAVAAPLKKITPHKLRSTYGTMLYQETGDIYLVADVLGHKDVNTTKKHYAAQSRDNRRLAAKSIRLRED